MTKFLSDCLEAPEPFFRQGVQRLESSNGNPSTDIRMSLEVQRSVKLKLQQLGLDPNDTTPQELYYHLQTKLKADDAKLVKALRTRAARFVSADGEVVSGMLHALKETADSKRGYGLKSASFKLIIKQMPPKKTMKQLGYRSLESFLKNESAAAILAAAKLCENEQWHQHLVDRYKKLQPSDFEDRTIEILQPRTVHWRQLASRTVASHKHNIICLKELGSLVLLPLPADAPVGTVSASLSLALHDLNELRASATYLKLCQVRPDFGGLVQTVATDQPQLISQALDMAIPWHLIQRYYARLQKINGDMSEPHLQLEDIAWHPVEATLKAIEPAFAFWQGSSNLAILHGRKPVSLNLTDMALNCCNQLSFDNRLSHYFQDSLWHELLLRYLRPNVVEQAIKQTLQPKLAMEMATT
jgi:hypothetical protein